MPDESADIVFAPSSRFQRPTSPLMGAGVVALTEMEVDCEELPQVAVIVAL